MTTISEGKRYRDRKCDEHGPMDPTGRADYPWVSPDRTLWTADGHSLSRPHENQRVLVAEVDAPSATPPKTLRDEFAIGDWVGKVGGDYSFEGIVVSVFRKILGPIRYVVEDDRGCLHIYSAKNLRARAKIAEG